MVVATVLMKGGNMLTALLAGVGIAVACGLFNGIIIAKSRCMPLIITLGTSQVFTAYRF